MDSKKRNAEKLMGGELERCDRFSKKRATIESTGRDGSTCIFPKLPPIFFLPPPDKVEWGGVANVTTREAWKEDIQADWRLTGTEAKTEGRKGKMHKMHK